MTPQQHQESRRQHHFAQDVQRQNAQRGRQPQGVPTAEKFEPGFPRHKYHKDGHSMVVKTSDHEKSLGEDWFDQPQVQAAAEKPKGLPYLHNGASCEGFDAEFVKLRDAYKAVVAENEALKAAAAESAKPAKTKPPKADKAE